MKAALTVKWTKIAGTPLGTMQLGELAQVVVILRDGNGNIIAVAAQEGHTPYNIIVNGRDIII